MILPPTGVDPNHGTPIKGARAIRSCLATALAVAVLLIATEAGNGEPERTAQEMYGHKQQPNPALPVRPHLSTRPGNSRGQPVGGVSGLLQAIQQADPNRPDHHLSLGTGSRLVLNTVQGIAHRGLTDLSGVRNLGVGQTPAEQAQ